MNDTQNIYGNGISVDGDYGPIICLDELYEAITQEPNVRSQAEARLIKKKKAKRAGPPPAFYAEANCLATARWGIIWPDDAALTPAERDHIAALRKHLEPLVSRRLQQMGIETPYEFYCKREWDHTDFLWEMPRRLGSYDFKPEVVPYYLMIVASPDQISWEFQQYLDITYGVGRLWFDEADDCAAYVKAVLAAEPDPNTDMVPATSSTVKQTLLVGTQHPGDGYTQLTSQYFVPGIKQWLDNQNMPGIGPTEVMLGSGTHEHPGAFKNSILQRWTGKAQDGSSVSRSALLVTATHGKGYPAPNVAQYEDQGALVCQDYGTTGHTALGPDVLLTGADISGVDLADTMSVCMACYGAGTPLKPDWLQPPVLGGLKDLADRPFVARLPQKMLAAGMLAFIGHVSQVWTCSFMGPEHQPGWPQLQLFTDAIGALLKGHRVGFANAWMNNKWPELTTTLNQWQKRKKNKKSKEEVANLWLARNDLRGWVILGDPATRLRG